MRDTILLASFFLGIVGLSVCKAQEPAWCQYTPNDVNKFTLPSTCKEPHIGDNDCTLYASCKDTIGNYQNANLLLENINPQTIFVNCDGHLMVDSCP